MKITPDSIRSEEAYLTIIAAVSENNVIGADGKIPWHIPEDLKFFKRETITHPIIMGRKTFESIGKPLPRRMNIVVTRNTLFDAPEGCIVVNTFEGALSVAFATDDNPFVIGGAELYQLALESTYAKKLILTRVHKNVEGNIKFPEVDFDDWSLDNIHSLCAEAEVYVYSR